MKNALTYTGTFGLQQFCTFYIAYIMFFSVIENSCAYFCCTLRNVSATNYIV